MAAPIRLTSPRLKIVFGDRADPDSWEAVEVQSTGGDMSVAEQLFARHKKQWGTPRDRPVKFQTVLAWYALKNTGQYTGSLEQFEVEALDVGDADGDADGDDDEEEMADPTQPEPGLD